MNQQDFDRVSGVLFRIQDEKAALATQLAAAVEVIKFYGATESWDSTALGDGLITESDVYAPWGDAGISVGGKRAREFLATIENNTKTEKL